MPSIVQRCRLYTYILQLDASFSAECALPRCAAYHAKVGVCVLLFVALCNGTEIDVDAMAMSSRNFLHRYLVVRVLRTLQMRDGGMAIQYTHAHYQVF